MKSFIQIFDNSARLVPFFLICGRFEFRFRDFKPSVVGSFFFTAAFRQEFYLADLCRWPLSIVGQCNFWKQFSNIVVFVIDTSSLVYLSISASFLS